MIGYKYLLIFNIILAGSASSIFDLVPRYYEEIKAPTAALYVGTDAAQIYSLQWPICHHPSTPETCESTPSFQNGFPGIEAYIDCHDSSYVIDTSYTFESATVVNFDNGTFCQTENTLLNTSTTSGYFEECDVVKYRELEICIHEVGSHSATFWSYFGLRFLYNWGMNSAYSLMDGTSVRMSEKFDSDYRSRKLPLNEGLSLPNILESKMQKIT